MYIFLDRLLHLLLIFSQALAVEGISNSSVRLLEGAAVGQP